MFLKKLILLCEDAGAAFLNIFSSRPLTLHMMEDTDTVFDRLSSLKSDAKKISQVMEVVVDDGRSDKEYIVGVYTKIRDSLSLKPGYPRLYVWAWTLLITSIRVDDQETLRAVDTVYIHIGRGGTLGDEKVPISDWHHKAVLYCWANMKDDGVGRRDPKDALALLAFVRTPGVFPNITPTEATSILQNFSDSLGRISSLRPFLFRLSLTTPGLFVLSYTTPYTQVVEHRHLTDKQVDLLTKPGTHFYETLYNMIPKKKGKFIGVDDLFKVMKDMDGGGIIERSLLTKSLPKNQVAVAYKDGFAVLKKAYFPNALPNIMIPLALEVVGITESYKESYALPGDGEVRCFQCSSSVLTIREPANNRPYCCNTCYEKDWKTCF